MLAHYCPPGDPSELPSKAQNLAELDSLAHRHAVDLFHTTKTKIVARALSSEESIRLLGSINLNPSNASRTAAGFFALRTSSPSALAGFN